MAGYVRNARGATAEDPCPTAGPKQYCGRVDFLAWKSQARTLYDRAIIPMWSALVDVSSSKPTPELQGLSARVDEYSDTYNSLPDNGHWFSVRKNKDLVSRTVLLVQTGDLLVDELAAHLEENGVTAPAVLMPGVEPRAPKHAWGQYAPAAAVLGATLLVVGLAALASAPVGGESE